MQYGLANKVTWNACGNRLAVRAFRDFTLHPQTSQHDKQHDLHMSKHSAPMGTEWLVHQRPIGNDNLRCQDVVTGQAMLPHCHADAATQRQTHTYTMYDRPGC